jgi:hypothetical protein
MAKKRILLITFTYALICLALYLVLFKIEGFSYTFTCTQNPGSVAPAAPEVDLKKFWFKLAPPEGCPAGLIEVDVPGGKMCFCSGNEQIIENNKCACPSGSTLQKFPEGKKMGLEGWCVCNKGTHATPASTRGGGGGAPQDPLKCTSKCPDEFDGIEQEIWGIKLATCGR